MWCEGREGSGRSGWGRGSSAVALWPRAAVQLSPSVHAGIEAGQPAQPAATGTVAAGAVGVRHLKPRPCRNAAALPARRPPAPLHRARCGPWAEWAGHRRHCGHRRHRPLYNRFYGCRVVSPAWCRCRWPSPTAALWPGPLAVGDRRRAEHYVTKSLIYNNIFYIKNCHYRT